MEKTLVTKLLELAREDAKYIGELETFRKSIVVMFTDLHGSTAYFERHGDVAGLMMIHEANEVVRTTVERHGGRRIKTIGDGTMCVFEEPAGSIQAAIEMQTTLTDMNSARPEDERASIRIGLHYGSGIVRSNDVFGDVVNVASRVEGVASPGQIVISEELRMKVGDRGFRIKRLGRFRLKGKTGEHSLFEVAWNPDADASTTAARTHIRVVEAGAPSKTAYKIQVLKKDGSTGAEYRLRSALTVGRSQGDLRFPSDASMSALNARFFVENGQVLVEDISEGGESIFVRLGATYILQDGDIIIMGQQAFRFHEKPGVMAAATSLGTSVGKVASLLHDDVAEFIRLDTHGRPIQHCALRTEEVQFGRTRATFTYTEDKLMSRTHARVLQRGEDFLLEDLGSRNGTFVKVHGRAPVPVGSAVLVGDQLLRVAEQE